MDMGTGTAPAKIQLRTLEDPLALLPCSNITEYRRGQIVYSSEQASSSLYLIIEGKIKVCRTTDEGRQVVIDIYQPDEFFGEAALLEAGPPAESAVAMEKTRVMSWTVSEIEELAGRKPNLALALLQLLVKRSVDFGSRIESFAVDNIARRLARSLIRFAERLGQKAEDGSVHMIPFTHELLSQYVGTSREIVTHYMNDFRRQGLLRYSRKGIQLCREPMETWLRHEESAGAAG